MNRLGDWKRKVLLVDASYFGHRIIHGTRIGNPDFNLESIQEQMERLITPHFLL